MLFVDRLYFTVVRYISDKQEVENILQETFIKIFAKLDQYDGQKASFNTWANTIAIRESLNHLRKRKLHFAPLDAVNIADQQDSIIAEIDMEYLLQLIDKLPEKYKIIFNMHEIDGYSHVDIEQMIGINQNTSRSYLSRAKKLLQKEIELLHQ